MILDAQGFSAGMLFSFLSFRQTFTDRTVGLINQTMQFRFLRLHLDRLADIVTAGAEEHPGSVGGAARCQGGYPVQERLVPLRRHRSADPRGHRPRDQTRIVHRHYRPSGGGKTTLIKLLLGLNRPTEGSIELDGYQATPELCRAWRQSAGVVAQDDQLLSGSIADNIACFDPDLDMQRVQEAAMAAQVHADIMRMPMQYLTLVGDMGSTLSGGQRQRVLLARALYRARRSSSWMRARPTSTRRTRN